MSAEVSVPALSGAALRQAWKERLERFATSGLSVVAFCHAEGVATQAFYYWKRQFSPQPLPTSPDPLRLVPVRVVEPPTVAATPVELVLPNGVLLRLAPSCDLSFLSRLLEALRSQPC